MFEDSLMESQNRLSSPNQRWTTALSFALQCALAAAVVVLPLLRPQALPYRMDAPKIVLLPRSVPQPIPRVEPVRIVSTEASYSSFARSLTSPARIPPLGRAIPDGPPVSDLLTSGMGDPDGTASALASIAPGLDPQVLVASENPASKKIPQISTGVSAGLLLAPITPAYPRIAVAAHVEGSVRVEAIISNFGHIESAQVISGPEMLRQAALDAIRNARYSPYRLNGAPTEVETIITVNFKLSN